LSKNNLLKSPIANEDNINVEKKRLDSSKDDQNKRGLLALVKHIENDDEGNIHSHPAH